MSETGPSGPDKNGSRSASHRDAVMRRQRQGIQSSLIGTSVLGRANPGVNSWADYPFRPVWAIALSAMISATNSQDIFGGILRPELLTTCHSAP